MKKQYDVVILGSGPAGYMAATYVARARLSVAVFQGYQAGGQLMLSTEIENFPGFDTGILGPELMERLEAQAERFGAELIPQDAIAVDFRSRAFVVQTDTDEYHARAVIVATGASARWLGLPNEQRLLGRGVSVCATCDGFFFREKDVVVVGGGDTAMEEALFLTCYARQVTIVHRRSTFRASPILVEKARQHPGIRFIVESEVVDVLGGDAVEGIYIRNTQTGTVSQLPVQGVFLAIGHHPNTDLFRGALQLDEEGYILPVERTMTSIAGVFAAGDVADPYYRQAITAAADGARAAMDVRRWLEQQQIEKRDLVQETVGSVIEVTRMP
ncbi:thioredoxin-disulfide reductase [Ktedonobacter sp. SOSP1-52]|uniref:thioredoxin-disulfide reductase n=1 Tax=Ktedonobacter sp. SOSP1-52 TaxID=2778366 RepID=UPI0019156F0F|nr:thioredoxin-disulfide reductase [Ktedonobacter sp. SOSP1-52]GHO63160.1 thioredoxin-disulfide reductase [Ktedonobacter sp. SOSP1-52]